MFDMSFDFSFLDNVCNDFDDSVNTCHLASKIAITDELVVKIKCLEDEVKKANHNISELNNAVDNIKQLYDGERTQKEGCEAEISILRKQNECLSSKLFEQEMENRKLSLLCEKASYDAEQKLKEEQKKHSVAYKSLGLQYVSQVKLLGEHNLLDSKSKKEFSDVRKKLEELCGVIVDYKSPRKSNVKKQKNVIKSEVKTVNASVECNLLDVHPQKEMVTTGTQYVNSTTTRASCTSAFIQKRAVGTMFPEPEHLTIEEILTNTVFDLPMPISPLTNIEDEVIVVSRNIGTQTEISSNQSIGTCTNIQNIRIPFKLGRKRIVQKCPPVLVPHIKLESPTGSTSHLNNLPLKIDVNTDSNVPGESSVLPLWNLMGQTIFTLIQNGISPANYSQLNMLNETMEIFNRNIQLEIAKKLQQFATQSFSINHSFEDRVNSKPFINEDHVLDSLKYNKYKDLQVPVACIEAATQTLPEHNICKEHSGVHFTDINKTPCVDSNLSVNSLKETFSHSKLTEENNNINGSSYTESSENFNGNQKSTTINIQLCDTNVPRELVITNTNENDKTEIPEIPDTKEINTNSNSELDLCELRVENQRPVDSDNRSNVLAHSAVDEILKLFPINYKYRKFKLTKKFRCKRKMKKILKRNFKISVSKKKLLKKQVKTFNEDNRENLENFTTCDKITEDVEFRNESENEINCHPKETISNLNETPAETNLNSSSKKRNCDNVENENETNLIINVDRKSENDFEYQFKRMKLENTKTIKFNKTECIQLNDILDKCILKINPISPIKKRLSENICDQQKRPDAVLCRMPPSSDDESDFEGYPDIETYADCPSSPPPYELDNLHEQNNIKIIPLEPITEENYIGNYSPLSPSHVDNTKCIVEPIVIPLERNNVVKKKQNLSKLKSLLGNYLNNYSDKMNSCLLKEKMNIENLNESKLVTKIRSILEHFLQSSCNDPDIAKSVNRIIIKTNNSDIIYKSIMEIIEDAKDSVQNNYTPPMPPMTETHRKMLILISVIQSNFLKFIPKFIEKIEQKLFNFKLENISVSERINLTILYIGLIDLEGGEKNRARLFIYKCLYYCGKFAVPMIYYILLTYPDVLPKKDDLTYDRSDPIISSIQCILTSLIYNMDNKELKHRPVFHILSLWYEYERVKPSKEEIIQNLMAKINCGKYDNISYSFALICKINGITWTENVVIQKNLIPALMDCYDLALASNEHDIRISVLLESLSFILKPFPLENGVCKYKQVFVNFLNVTDRQIIQEAAVAAVLRMQRFGYCEVFNIICKWNPSYKISKYLKVMLYSFLLRKPLKFWKKLENQL